MNKSMVIGAIAVAAVFGAVLYFASDRTDEIPAAMEAATEAPAPAADARAPAEPLRSTSGLPIDPAARNNAVSRPAPSDPRLAALAVSPDNGRIQFITGPDGRVIQEIDNDQGSPSFKKPLREYMYAGERVVGLTRYQYLGDKVQVTKTLVSYKPDGSVDRFDESTGYQQAKTAGNGG
jgi:hypothetical protein